jgi:hypothetical protein
MKKALAAVLVASIVGLVAVGAMAQVPNVQVYFNSIYNETQADCQPPGTPQDLFVVMNNWNMFVQAVDFSIDYPAGPLFISGEDAPPDASVIGSSDAQGGAGGIAVGFLIRENGYAPVLALTVHATWTANCECSGGPQAIVVRGYQYGDQFGKLNPSAIQWPDFFEVEGLGMTSLICPGPVAVEESTWGGVKALYR